MNLPTPTETINLAWLRYLIIGISIIWLVVIFGNDEQTFVTVVAYIFFIGYFGIKQVGVFTNNHPSLAVCISLILGKFITQDFKTTPLIPFYAEIVYAIKFK